MALNIPTVVARYYAAEAARDYAGLSLCFDENGWVRDEGKVHKGRDAIARWMANAKDQYRHESEPLSAEMRDGKVVVDARVSGSFPGSPVNLNQAFRIVGEHIQSLEIG